MTIQKTTVQLRALATDANALTEEGHWQSSQGSKQSQHFLYLEHKLHRAQSSCSPASSYASGSSSSLASAVGAADGAPTEVAAAEEEQWERAQAYPLPPPAPAAERWWHSGGVQSGSDGSWTFELRKFEASPQMVSLHQMLALALVTPDGGQRHLTQVLGHSLPQCVDVVIAIDTAVPLRVASEALHWRQLAVELGQEVTEVVCGSQVLRQNRLLLLLEVRLCSQYVYSVQYAM
jgi:hypothetical protein